MLVGMVAFGMGCKTNTIFYPLPYGNFIGRMTGRVVPLDVQEDSLTNLYSGTFVNISGTKFQTTTDANGAWKLDSVPAGIYTIQFSRPGFNTGSIVDYKFSGSGVAFMDDAVLIQLPTDSIVLDSLSFGVNPQRYLLFSGHISSKVRQYYHLWTALDGDTAFTDNHYEGAFVDNGQYSGVLNSAASISQTIPARVPFASGQHVRMKAQLAALPFGIQHSNTDSVTYFNREMLSPPAAAHFSNTVTIVIP